MTTRNDIRRFLQEGKESGATHVIIVCDTFDYEDYPVSVMPEEDARVISEHFSTEPMSQVMEVYNLSLPLEPQLAQGRAFNY